MKPGITYDEFKVIAEDMTNRGEGVMPTKVRQALGDRGSFTTIRNYIKRFESEGCAQHKAQNSSIPEVVQKAMKEHLESIWNVAEKAANTDVEEIRSAASRRVSQLEDELNDAYARLEELETEAEKHLETVEEYHAEIAQLKESKIAVDAELRTVSEKYQELMQKFDIYTALLNNSIQRFEAMKKPDSDT